jgi:hypothetical protein
VLPIGPTEARGLLQAAVTAVSVLGGVMAFMSGYFATQTMAAEKPPNVLAHRINEGIGRGFAVGWPMAVSALIIEIWI